MKSETKLLVKSQTKWFLVSFLATILATVGFFACQALTPSQQQSVVDGSGVVKSLPPLIEGAATLPGTSTKTSHDLSKAAGVMEKAGPIAGAVAGAATQPGATPVTVIVGGVEAATASGLIPQPIAGYISLGLLLLSLIGNAIQKHQTTTAQTATASVTNAFGAGVASGKIQVLPGATGVVDAAVNGHPTTDAIVDLVVKNGGGEIK